MNDRERFVACLLGEPADRPPYWLYWSPWPTTWQRWQREGLPEQITDFADLRSHFGSDQPPRAVPVNYGPCPRFERTVLAEDEDSVTFVDEWGIRRKNLKGRESMSQFLAHPVQNREDWERFRAERLDPDHPDRLMGDEESLVAFYSMPDLVWDIMEHLTAVYLRVFEKVVQAIQVDVIHIWEDMCYVRGPLISPKHWEEFMEPHYRRIHRFAREQGIPLISVDTDGDPNLIIPPMMRAGVNFLFPLEVAAGCDVNGLQAQYPTLGMMGGIDKRALAQGPPAIDRELTRIQPAVQRGRYIPALDHLVPDDVSWENYCYYARALKELVGKP